MTTPSTPKKVEKSLKSSTQPEVTSAPATGRAHLSPIMDLIKNSFEQVKNNFGSFSVLFVIQTFVFIALFVVAAVIGIAGGLGAGLSAGLNGQSLETLFEGNNFLPVLATAGIFVVVLMVLAIIASIFIGVIFQGAFIAMANAGEDKLSLGESLKVGRARLVPLFVAAMVGGLLVLGGFFLFVIPGIVIAILLSFASYAIVIDNMKAMDALRYSAGLVKQHFWEVLGRFVVLILINIAVSMILAVVLEALRSAIGESATGLISFVVNLIVNIGMMAFSVVFATQLYRELKTATGVMPMSLKGLAIIGIVGLVISGFVMYSATTLIMSAARNLPANFGEEMGREMMLDSDSDQMYYGDEMMETTDYDNMTQEDWEMMIDEAIRNATASGQPSFTTDDGTVTNFEY